MGSKRSSRTNLVQTSEPAQIITQDQQNGTSSERVASFISNIGQTFWTVIVGAGVFFATLYSTQSVTNTKIEYVENEIKSLKDSDTKIISDLTTLKSEQNTLLKEISLRLREMEIKLTELQVKLNIAIENNKAKELKPIEIK